jgi:hypothetical protein
MSKHKQEPALVDEVPAPQVQADTPKPQSPQVLAPAAPPAPPEQPVPKVLPIGQAANKQIRCPRCGKPAAVTNARGARTQQQVISSLWWMLIRCSGIDGAFLEHSTTLVTLLETPHDPVIKQLAHVIGKDVHCPMVLPDGTVCWARGKGEWTIDEAHGIRCCEHGFTAFPGNQYVELWQD